MSFARTKVVPTLAVTDLEAARVFYGGLLEFEEIPTPEGEQGATMYRVGEGSFLLVYERPTPSGSTATACAFAVMDVEDSVKRLRKKGVAFEEYDIPELGIRTRDGIADMGEMKAAWFKDPSGNILAIDDSLSLLEGRGLSRPTGREEGLHA
ncbi:VOC family protein [Myxococcus sp. K15C18031901]|uniref:VOC family protein n=1 Tax=Myxococcus dinghuensis TaxID=2906761 RepID=UPI0020A787C4|nr:VOC family protein [Myxococcus dinghuensis]MCP3099906.1 VOC family protein [Myxococcus dinghuensis]